MSYSNLEATINRSCGVGLPIASEPAPQRTNVLTQRQVGTPILTMNTINQPKEFLQPKISNQLRGEIHSHEVSPLVEELAQLPTHENTSGDGSKRSAEYIQWRDDSAMALQEAGMFKQAEAFDNCAKIPHQKITAKDNLPQDTRTVWVCPDSSNHDVHVFGATCDCRFCPDCAHRQMARFVNRFVTPILDAVHSKKRGYRLKHIVLTTPHGLEDENIEAEFIEFQKLINKLFDDLLPEEWRKTMGLVASIEFGSDGHKMHAHILFYGQFIPKDDLTKSLMKLTNNVCKVNWIEEVKGSDDEIKNAVVETLKYSVKFYKSDPVHGIQFIEPHLVPKLAKILHRKRRVKALGIFYGLGQPEREDFCCEQCNAVMARIGVEHYEIWQNTGFLLHEWQIVTSDQPQAVLDLILANKSRKKRRNVDKPPPEIVQKDMFADVEFGKSSGHYADEDDL